MEKISNADLQKIYNGLDNLRNESVIRIEKIEKRLYSNSFFDDLQLGDYNKFFEETIRYIKTKLSNYEVEVPLKDGVKKLIEDGSDIPFIEKSYNFLGVFSSFFRNNDYDFVYIEETAGDLRAVRDQAQNVMDWIKVQIW